VQVGTRPGGTLKAQNREEDGQGFHGNDGVALTDEGLDRAVEISLRVDSPRTARFAHGSHPPANPCTGGEVGDYDYDYDYECE
jgi:hypothetical protein